MFSVVIPTMWVGKEIQYMLPGLEHHPLVSEILLIDNAPQSAPVWFREYPWKKIRKNVPPGNIGVNPAWDLGIRSAVNDRICLYSDDVEFDPTVFDVLADKLEPSDGLVGPWIPKFPVPGPIRVDPCQKMRFGYGSLMFLNRKNYIPFPPVFRIFFGDVWLFRNDLQNGRSPRMLTRFNIKSKLDTTSGLPVFSEQTQIEKEAWVRNYGPQEIYFDYS